MLSSSNSATGSALAKPAFKSRFRVWQDELEAAQSWVEHGERTPTKARFASSLVLLRDSAHGPETFLSYRQHYSPLGTVAFPGGLVEATDDVDASSRWAGPSPAAWAKTMGTEDIALARKHVVAVIRETFEETGILLAGTDASSLIDVVPSPEWMKKREALAAQEFSFQDILSKRGLVLRTDLLKPVVNWISPDFAHRRFNTRYFAAAAPVNQTPTPLESKSLWGRWACPPKLVAEPNSTALGDEIGLPNTVGRPLFELVSSGFDLILSKIAISRGCIAYLNHKRSGAAYKPRLVVEDGEFWLEVDVAAMPDGICRER
ncbi:phosphohydrolase (MutT/nudix family protein) [Renibacterium salmoninarum ATCC 33209]|uniref:Phosphohydrolase (MutT/nudix family protein) n=1 Tax=Renibacterium salmoninarum (strain ATCC 33209 / DSM 20767 / JCM 11484 / NBRC 15589 / NCIMB 2235) TaxID=288705 RepID=A9WTJ6_RENSM|nr:phosphohydrolase (MutT/nudix family protein) [Renibacterium salmoninarum ATCC 33209]